MRSRFFQAVDEENLFNRIDKVMAECGAFLPLETDLRIIFYLSDKADDRNNKKNKPQANHSPIMPNR